VARAGDRGEWWCLAQALRIRQGVGGFVRGEAGALPSGGVIYVLAQGGARDLADGAVLLAGASAHGLGEVGVEPHLQARRLAIVA
jgi:hypothetical protein